MVSARPFGRPVISLKNRSSARAQPFMLLPRIMPRQRNEEARFVPGIRAGRSGGRENQGDAQAHGHDHQHQLG